VSHLPERNEKICLNCYENLHGRYCHKCGQENLEPKETFWHLITHFVYDVTHFDGKFFATLKMLLRRPGMLSKEYALGKRASYLNPIRMYIFTSAFFFIIFFSFIRPAQKKDDAGKTSARQELATQEKRLQFIYDSTKDSVKKANAKKGLEELRSMRRTLRSTGIIQYDLDDKDTADSKTRVIGSDKDNDPATVAQYDSIQRTLSSEKKHGWLKRMFMRKKISINEKYEGNDRRFWEDLQEKFLHSIPQMMFVSLPLVAAILQLLYVRRRKQFYYVNHIIFVIHVYIALYIIILFNYLLGALKTWSGWSIFSWITGVMFLFMLYYVYKAMRNFYEQSRGKTILKYILLFILCTLAFTLLMLIFLLTSALQI
jgi:hypothetical protein